MIRKPRILIVDDEPLNVKLLSAMISSDGYAIEKAFSGEQALEKVKRESPDLVLLDIMMPGINGLEVTRRLKSGPETRDIPIILITASDVTDLKVIGTEAGADEFLNKPIKTPELKSRMKSLLRTKEYHDQLRLQRENQTDKKNLRKEKAIHGQNDIASVLLVFKEEHDAKLIQMFLQGQPYRVTIVKNTEDSIVLSKQKNIDLILLDVTLQEKEVFETCIRLKEKEKTANTQMLLIAEPEYFEKKHQEFELWSDDFLIKPINVHELRSRVKALLKKKVFLDRLYDGTKESIHSAITDSLSGLGNHSYFKYFLEHELKRSLRDGRPVTLIMMELSEDRLNPNLLGHPAGEELLRSLGTLIKENIRDVDLGARYKEKQFAIVLANTDRNGAVIVTRRIKDLIHSQFSLTNDDMSSKNSALNIGVSVYPYEADSIESMILQAENELFESKSANHLPIY